MKKLLSIALITFTLFSATACGSKEIPSQENPISDSTEKVDTYTNADETLTLSKINESSISPKILRDGIKTETTSEDGTLTTEITNPDGSIIRESSTQSGTKTTQIKQADGIIITETIIPDQMKTLETINLDGSKVVETTNIDGTITTDTTASDGTTTTKKIHLGSGATGTTSSSSSSGSSITNNPITPSQMADTTNSEMQTFPKKGDQIATLSTNIGDIKILLYTDLAPNTAKNFIELTKMKSYDGIIFHRVINDFMIQTGDFEFNNGTGGYTYLGKGTSLKDEFGAGLTHIRGSVSMANAGPNTGGSQFFIVQKQDGTDWLDGKHAIFGYVFEGMDVVDKIAKVEKNSSDKPLVDIVVEEVSISTF